MISSAKGYYSFLLKGFVKVALISIALQGGECLGQSITVSGNVTPTYNGTDNPWDIQGMLLKLGLTGAGSVDINGGAKVVALNTFVGDALNGSGTISLNGVGSELISTGITRIGNAGAGDFSIESGAYHRTTSDFYIGHSASSTGVVTVTGTDSLLSVGKMHVGFAGQGFLNIENGGKVEFTTVSIGEVANASGEVHITGNGSILEGLASPLVVGERGFGQLTIRDGGLANTQGGVIGAFAGASGQVIVRGAGSKSITGNNSISVNNGSLTIEDEGVINSGSLFVATGFGSNAVVAVTGTNTRLNISTGRSLSVGDSQGQGELQISAGAVVTATNVSIGRANGASGLVMVTDDGSQLLASTFFVGSGAGTSGAIDVKAGGKVSSSSVLIGFQAGSGGIVTVSGIGSQWISSTEFSVGGSQLFGNGGTGTLNIDNDGIVSVGNTLKVFNAGTINLLGGRLEVQTLDMSETGSTFNNLRGTLKAGNFVGDLSFGAGTVGVDQINGSLTQTGGILAPGNSPGSTHITGDYNFSSGVIEIEIAGLNPGSQYDFIDIDGLALLDATTSVLNVRFLDGFQNSILATDSFTILNMDGGLSGNFAGLSNGSIFQTADGLGSFQISYTSNSVVLSNFTAVPEPAMLTLTAVLLGTCTLVRRKSMKN